MDAFQAQLRQAIDTQLASLAQQYEQAIADARSAATQEAEQAIATRIDWRNRRLQPASTRSRSNGRAGSNQSWPPRAPKGSDNWSPR